MEEIKQEATMQQKTWDPKDVQENKVMAFLSYLGILVLIPLLAKKDSPFAQFHAKQGLVLFIFWIVLGVVSVIPFLGWLIGIVGFFFGIVLEIMGIVYALSGKAKELPLIGGLAKNFKF